MPYFMWASDDDLWEPQFIEQCLAILAHNPGAAMAFGTVDHINKNDAVIERFPGFSRFQSGCDRYSDARIFIRDPAVGKPNLFYGLYRTEVLKRTIKEIWDLAGFNEWAADMVFLYGFVCRYPIITTDDVLMHKRSHTDATVYSRPGHPKGHFIPRREYRSFLRRYQAVSPTPRFARLARTELRRRLIESFVFKHLSRFGLV
jgi:hypothetical protein